MSHLEWIGGADRRRFCAVSPPVRQPHGTNRWLHRVLLCFLSQIVWDIGLFVRSDGSHTARVTSVRTQIGGHVGHSFMGSMVQALSFARGPPRREEEGLHRRRPAWGLARNGHVRPWSWPLRAGSWLTRSASRKWSDSRGFPHGLALDLQGQRVRVLAPGASEPLPCRATAVAHIPAPAGTHRRQSLGRTA